MRRRWIAFAASLAACAGGGGGPSAAAQAQACVVTAAHDFLGLAELLLPLHEQVLASGDPADEHVLLVGDIETRLRYPDHPAASETYEVEFLRPNGVGAGFFVALQGASTADVAGLGGLPCHLRYDVFGGRLAPSFTGEVTLHRAGEVVAVLEVAAGEIVATPVDGEPFEVPGTVAPPAQVVVGP